MKVKSIYNRSIAFILSIVIIIFSSLSYSIPVHAVTKTYTSWEDFKEDANATIMYMCTQLGALFTGHDFVQYVENKEGWDNYWNEDNVTVDSDNVTFSPDLVAFIKQALKEYQNEQYGYQILPTVKYDQIPVSVCGSASAYRTMCELVSKYKLLGLYVRDNTINVKDLSAYNNGTAGFVIHTYYTDCYEIFAMDYISWQYSECDSYWAYNIDKTYTTLEELKEYCQSGSPNSYGQDQYTRCIAWISGIPSNYSNTQLVSYSGSDVLVFNSETSLKNYSVDKRGVFTTKDFYEDTGELTLKLDDLNNSIGDLTDLLSQFKDLLGKQEGGLTEEQLQQLLQQFLDDFFERLGEQGGESGGGGSSGGGTSGGGASSSWYDSVLDYLNNILKQLKSIKRWTVVDTVIDGVDAIADWLDLIHDVLSDADDGAESAVATLSSALDDATGLLKSKFPFSIPWDILLLVTVFAADPEAPYFEIPIQFDISGIGISIDYTFVVDFKDYDYLSQICRAVLSMIYAVGLMKMTANVAMIKKED